VAVAQSASGARALETARAADSAVDLPVDVADLQYSLERAVALRWQLNDPQLQELLNEVENLPSPPEALVELSSLLSQSSIEIPQVAAVVESDPAMTAKLMQLVNSAYFGLPQKMTDVRQIVSYLGLNTVRNLLTAMEMLNAFPDIEADLKEDVQVHRQHAMSVAELARRIVKTQAAQHDAFSGGMLHDIGLLALMSCAPNRYRSLKSEVQSGRMPFDVCELEVIGTTHAAFGAQLMKNWMLPTPIVEAVARSHDADLLSDRIPHATHAVFVAEQAVSSSSEDPWWETSRQPDPVYLQALGWSELF
jgi:HD-like signal output (HDOD) protein